LQSVKKHIQLNENPERFKFPGLDSKGLITAGSGEQVNDEKSFVALPFEIDGRLATDTEKREGFQKLQAEKGTRNGRFNTPFSTYKTTTKLTLPNTKADARMEAKIAEKLPGIVNEIGIEKWQKLPPGQKNALIDSAYSVGGLKGFPRMIEAARQGDTAAMARESFSRSGDQRNWERNQNNHAAILGQKPNDPETEKAFTRDFLKDKSHKAEDLPAQYQRYVPKNTPEAEIKGGAGGDNLGEGALSAPKPEVRPEVKAFFVDVKKPLDQEDQEIRLKNPKSWTKDEMQTVMNSKDYWGDDRENAFKQVAEWHSKHYGDEPVKRLSSGQMIQPELKRQPNESPIAAKTADGHDMSKAASDVGNRVAQLAGKTKLASAVKSLQAGLNLMGQKVRVPLKQAPLKQDGVFGPKTKTAMRATLATQGKGKTEEAFGLGNINRIAQKTRKFGNAEGLGRRLDKAVAPLFGAKPTRSAKPTYKPWGEAMQGAVNDTGIKAFGDKKWEPIKEDGIVGPKTENAFASVAKRVEPEEVTKQFGNSLGWL